MFENSEKNIILGQKLNGITEYLRIMTEYNVAFFSVAFSSLKKHAFLKKLNIELKL